MATSSPSSAADAEQGRVSFSGGQRRFLAGGFRGALFRLYFKSLPTENNPQARAVATKALRELESEAETAPPATFAAASASPASASAGPAPAAAGATAGGAF